MANIRRVEEWTWFGLGESGTYQLQLTSTNGSLYFGQKTWVTEVVLIGLSANSGCKDYYYHHTATVTLVAQLYLSH